MFTKNLTIVVLLLGFNSPIFCGDLDDGIGLDKPINDDINAGINIEFIKRNAKAKAKRRAGEADTLTSRSQAIGGGESSECGGAGNIQIGPGTDLKGVKQIINISTNKGVSTICQ
jgi:hypothetical protein